MWLEISNGCGYKCSTTPREKPLLRANFNIQALNKNLRESILADLLTQELPQFFFSFWLLVS